MLKRLSILLFTSLTLSFGANNNSIQDPKLNQFIETIKKLSEEKQKMNPYAIAQQQKQNSEPTIQEKMMKEQQIHQYIEMKQNYDPTIISSKIDIAIKSLKSMKKHLDKVQDQTIPYFEKYSIRHKTYLYIDRDDIAKIEAQQKQLKTKNSVISMLIDRLNAFKEGIKDNKSLIITQELQQIIQQIDSLYQNYMLIFNRPLQSMTNIPPSNIGIPQTNKLMKVYVGQKLSNGIKIKKIDDSGNLVIGL